MTDDRASLSPEQLGALARIHRRYRTLTVPVTIGSIAFPFTRIEDPDAVLDQVAEDCDRLEKLTGNRESDPQHLPYWAELWDSAPGIGQFLERRRSEMAGKNVLDLGCGMGLSGTVAAALGARVMFCDLESSALLFAQLNSLPWKGQVRARTLNWQKDDLQEQFDWILGADILYERKQWEHLDRFWRKHLERGGRILLGEPGRHTGDPFADWAREQGWSVIVHAEPVSTRPGPIRIFELISST